MSQSTFVATALLAGFVLFLAAEGRLPEYGAALWGNTKASTPSSKGSSGGIFGKALGAVKTAGEIAAIAGG